MGWFSDIADAVTGGGDDDGGGWGWVGDAIGGALDIWGNQKANDQANDARKASSKAQQKAMAEANARLQYLVDAGAPARSKLMQISAQNPYVLTPEQLIGREDNLRAARTNLAASGLRGAGRAGVGLINDSDRRYMAQAVAQNQQRGDSATSTLAGDQVHAVTGQAANSRSLGTALGTNEVAMGQNNAATTLGNAQVAGSTLGALASVIAGQNKTAYQDKQTKA